MTPILMDFHSHILPAVDHGASDIKESISFLKAAGAVGIQTVVATSHFYPHEHTVKQFLAHRSFAYEVLLKACQGQNLPRLLLGAEVLLCAGLENMDDVEQLCVEETKTLLLELPFSITKDSESLFDSVEALLREKKLTVVLAHPNRYETAVIERALALGCLLQLNMEDLLRFRERSRIKNWVRMGAVVAVGSDIHHEPSIYKKFGKGASVLGETVQFVNETATSLTKATCTS